MADELDLTEHLHRYRECCRGLWNNFLRAPDFERVEVFDGICEVLFAELVLRHAGPHDVRVERGRPVPFLLVRLKADRIPAMIRHGRSTSTAHYWDDPVDHVTKDATMTFVECFDWDVLSNIDLQYVRVRIDAYPSEPSVVGRDALIEAQYVRLVARTP